MEPIDSSVERVLEASRPEPSLGFVDGLERRLVIAPDNTSRWAKVRPRPWNFTAGLVTGALAAGLLLLGLTGFSPLDQGSPDVTAGDGCRYVRVTQVERVPRVVTRNGEATIVMRDERVQRRIKRCR